MGVEQVITEKLKSAFAPTELKVVERVPQPRRPPQLAQ